MPPRKDKKEARKLGAESVEDVAAKWFSTAAPSFSGGSSKPKKASVANDASEEPVATLKRASEAAAPDARKKERRDKEDTYLGAPAAPLPSREKGDSATAWFNELAKKLAKAGSATGGAVLLSERPDVWDAAKDEAEQLAKRKRGARAAAAAVEKDEEDEEADEEAVANDDDAAEDDDDDDADDDEEEDGGDDEEAEVSVGGGDGSPYERAVPPTVHRLQLVGSHTEKLDAIAAFIKVFREKERLAGKREKARVVVFVSDYKVARALEGKLGRRITVHRRTNRAFGNIGVDVRIRGVATLHDKLLEWQSKLNVRRFRAGKAVTMVATDECAGPLFLVRNKIGLVVHCDVPAGRPDALETVERRESFAARPRCWFPESLRPAAGAADAVDERRNETFMVLNSTNANKSFAGDYAPVMARKQAGRVAQALAEFAATRSRKPLA